MEIRIPISINKFKSFFHDPDIWSNYIWDYSFRCYFSAIVYWPDINMGVVAISKIQTYTTGWVE